VRIEQGLADTTVVPSFDAALARSLSAVGDRMAYRTYAGATHATVMTSAADDATQFLRRRFGR
jgi:hypothetical protein